MFMNWYVEKAEETGFDLSVLYSKYYFPFITKVQITGGFEQENGAYFQEMHWTTRNHMAEWRTTNVVTTKLKESGKVWKTCGGGRGFEGGKPGI